MAVGPVSPQAWNSPPPPIDARPTPRQTQRHCIHDSHGPPRRPPLPPPAPPPPPPPPREEPAGSAWRVVVPEGQQATLSYTVTASEDDGSRGISQVYVGTDTAFVLPVSCMVYLPGRESLPCEVRLDLPTGWLAAAP